MVVFVDKHSVSVNCTTGSTLAFKSLAGACLHEFAPCFGFTISALVLTRWQSDFAHGDGQETAHGTRCAYLPFLPGMHVGDESSALRHYFMCARLLMTFVLVLVASSIFLMTVMGPCVFSCGTHAGRGVACCSSLIYRIFVSLT